MLVGQDLLFKQVEGGVCLELELLLGSFGLRDFIRAQLTAPIQRRRINMRQSFLRGEHRRIRLVLGLLGDLLGAQDLLLALRLRVDHRAVLLAAMLWA